MSNKLTLEEQQLINRWVEVVNGANWRDPDEESAFESFVREINREHDLWNSPWAGFHRRLSIGPITDLSVAVHSAHENGGNPSEQEYSAADAILGFRGRLSAAWEVDPIFGLIEMKASNGDAGWLFFGLGDRGEIESIGLTPSPESFVESYREAGFLILGGDLPDLPNYDDEILSDEAILKIIENSHGLEE